MSSGAYTNPHQNAARAHYGPGNHRLSSASGSMSPPVGNNAYHSAPYYSANEGSQSFHAPAQIPLPDHRIHHNRTENYQHQSSQHRNNDYNQLQRSPNYVIPSDADYHPSNGERRKLYHSMSSSSNISTSSVGTPHSQQHGMTHMPSPKGVSRPSGSYRMDSTPHRPPYSSNQGNASQESLYPHSNRSASPPSATETARDKIQPDVIIDRKVSCLECRSSKVKCSGQIEGESGCERCKRIKRECIFEQHRRGRKPAQLKMHKLEQSVDTIMTALSALQEFKQKKQALREMAEEENEDEVGSIVPQKRRSDSDSFDTQAFQKQIRPLWAVDRRSTASEEPTKSEGSTEYNSRKTTPPDLMSRGEPVRSADLEAEESQELGLPPMSNPLKLLAQASNSAMDHNATPAPTKSDYDGMSQGGQIKVTDQATSKQPSMERTERGVSRREYWSLGLYSSKLDKGPHLDPIHCNIMTKKVGKDLFQLYMTHLNDRITLLDPYLATFNYVRGHSALLLTSACALAARFASHIPDAERLANNLDAHIQEKVLPAVLLQGYRSVEISQAFIIMAAFHRNTNSLDGDRSWSLLGYGIRIAAELDMNARMIGDRNRFNKNAHTPSSAQADTPASNKVGDEDWQMSADEAFQRKIRNRERTWCNLWLFENSLSTHMGRRSTLGQDPVILGVCAGWNRGQYACSGDEAIVALIQLRRLQTKNMEYFEHSILSDVIKQSEEGEGASTPSKNTASASLKFQLDFYRSSCSADVAAWRAMYVEGEEGRSVRMKNARLYLSYARLILNSYALKCTQDQTLLEPIYKESYNSAMTYLTLFSERLESPELVYVHNSSVVTVAYVAVFALRLCSLDRKRYPYINSCEVFDHVRALSKALARAGSVTAWRNGAASSYAPYLSAVLHRVEKTINRERKIETRYDPALSPSAQIPTRTRDADSIPRFIDSPYSTTNGSQNQNSKVNEDAVLMNLPTKRLAFAPSAKDNNTNRSNAESLSFIAGPSGVQASAVLEELATSEGLQFGQNFFEDQVMEASLFSDMNFLLHDQNFTSWLTPQQQLNNAINI